MKEFIIRENEAGQRFDKYLSKLLPAAPKSFIYKMLRKKNFKLNDKKASGGEKLKTEDKVSLYLSQETFEKFSAASDVSYKTGTKLDILYEDAHVLLVNKPVGMLSQKASPGDTSLVEYLIGYLLDTKAVTKEELSTFHPSVCNRLDRNTSGIVVCGKSLAGLQQLSRLFSDRRLHKYYLCAVKGVLKEEKYIHGYLHKDQKCNKVRVCRQKEEGALPIETRYLPLGNNGEFTLLFVSLLTGRSHQIRAHLASIRHPVLGDRKYGDSVLNTKLNRVYALENQLLHSFLLEMPKLEGVLSGVSGKTFCAPVPGLFLKILKGEHLEESYYEILERNMGICQTDTVRSDLRRSCGSGSLN